MKIFPSGWNGFQSAKEVVKPSWQVANTPTHPLEWPKKFFDPKSQKITFRSQSVGGLGALKYVRKSDPQVLFLKIGF
jgi:hypothetical protein